MCRLYGLIANEPTKIECSLVRAQNALMAQSQRDYEGGANAHGWGVAAYTDGVPLVEKQAWAAYDGEHFKKAAARVYAKTVIAHVRRATVGPPGLENTHPFVHGKWIFAHNGTVPHFERVRERLLDEIDPLHLAEIKGSTDSELVFRYVLTLWDRQPERPLVETLRLALERVVAICRKIDRSTPIGLNVLMSDGERMIGSRMNRSLRFLERDGIELCEICGQSHVQHNASRSYQAVEIASEPITAEAWLPIPNGTVFSVDPDFGLNILPFGPEAFIAAEGTEALPLH